MAKKEVEALEIDILGDLGLNFVESKKKPKAKKKPVISQGEWDIDTNNILVGRLSNSNIDWKKIGDKNLILKMAQIFSEKYNEYKISTTSIKRTKFNVNLKRGLTKSTDVDWDRFLSMPLVAKYQEDVDKDQRKRDVAEAQSILRDSESESEDITRAKTILQMNKDLIGEEVQTNSNDGLIINHVSLNKIEDHINREKELAQ